MYTCREDAVRKGRWDPVSTHSGRLPCERDDGPRAPGQSLSRLAFRARADSDKMFKRKKKRKKKDKKKEVKARMSGD